MTQNRIPRIVAYSRERRVYLSYNCMAETPDRTWAWSGSPRQARNMIATYPAAENFCLYWDGEEKTGGIPFDVA